MYAAVESLCIKTDLMSILICKIILVNNFIYYLVFILINLFFEKRFLCVAWVILELALQNRLTLNSQSTACFWLSSAGIKDVSHPWQPFLILIYSFLMHVVYSVNITTHFANAYLHERNFSSAGFYCVAVKLASGYLANFFFKFCYYST